MGHMTAEEIDALQATKLDRATPFVICGVSRSQLSVARFFFDASRKWAVSHA